jgi:hypothetical protein
MKTIYNFINKYKLKIILILIIIIIVYLLLNNKSDFFLTAINDSNINDDVSSWLNDRTTDICLIMQ